MANFIKKKVVISLFSISFIILIHQIQSKFNAPVTLKRWTQLTWDDFQGIPQPFTRFDARISSGVFLEFNSIDSTYHAYSAQNNIRSWVRKESTSQRYLLNHEQYHFNISELHARLLNKYINENPEDSEYSYFLRLESIRVDLNEMQDRYDEETNHSTYYDKQRKWEHKVDSLLTLDSGWVTDYFSGARIYFPVLPELSKGLTRTEVAYRTYSLKRYDMSMSLTSYQSGHSFDSTFRVISKLYNTKSLRQDSSFITLARLDTTRNQFYFILKDTSNYTHHSVWVHNGIYLFNIALNYPNNNGDTTGYSQIARSFIQSFSVVNTDDFWVKKLETLTSPPIHSKIVQRNSKKDRNSLRCFVPSSIQSRGFYRGPVYREDGALLLAYDNIEHTDSLLLENLLKIEDDLYFHSPDPSGLVYLVPHEKLPRGQPFQVAFGYFLKKDTINQCPKLYFQTIDVDPSESKKSLPIQTEQ